MLKRKEIVTGLVVVNAVLMGALAWRATSQAVTAQVGAAPATVRGDDVILIPGEASGASVGIVYALDQNSGVLGAIAVDNRDRLQGMPPIALAPIFEAARQADQPAAPRPRR